MLVFFLTPSFLCLLAYNSVAADARPYPGDKRFERPTVETSAGTFSGTHSRYRDDVEAFLGIPYAQSPIGDLRFEAPLKLNKLDDVYDASEFGPDCPAIKSPVSGNFTLPPGTKILQALSQNDTPISEDCLTLSIWRKKDGYERRDKEQKGKPVIIWIYGGGFTTGSVSVPLYDGSYFASDEDVIFAAISYRLNIFGFPGAPGLHHQNLGLRDIRLAVEWIRDNIASFGGDPEQMVLEGQSAGAAAVDMWAYAYKDDPIVKGLIAQSGAASDKATDPDSDWYDASERLGCGDQSAGDLTIACMREKSVDELLSLVAPFNSLERNSFLPTADGEIVFLDYEARGISGDFAQLPLLNGNNEYEEGFSQVMNRDLPKEALDAIGRRYTCGTRTSANRRATNGVPVWRYRYYGDFPNARLFDGSGAYHTSEIFTLFGTAEPVTEVRNTPRQEIVGDEMRHVWSTFARDPVNGLNSLGWPNWNKWSPSLVLLGHPEKKSPSFASPIAPDWDCISNATIQGD